MNYMNEFVSEDYQITISEDDQRNFLLAVFRMAQENHLGCTRLMFKLLDMKMPPDWDNREQNRHKWRDRKPATEQQVIHLLCAEE